MFLTIHWMTNPWKLIRVLLPSTNLVVKYSSLLLYQSLFFKKKISAHFSKEFTNCILCSSYLFCRKLWKQSIWKWTCQWWISWCPKKAWPYETNWRVVWTIPSYYCWVIWCWIYEESSSWLPRCIFLMPKAAIESENHATLFWSHFWYKFLLMTYLQKQNTEIFSIMKNSFTCNIKFPLCFL